MHKILGIATVLLLLAIAPTQETNSVQPTVQLPPDLARVLTSYESAWQRSDPHALAMLFAPDGFVLANRARPVRGRNEIERAYARAGGPLSLRAISFDVDRDMAFIIGCFKHNAGETDRGKFTLVLVRDPARGWLIESGMDNSIDENQ